MLELTQQTLLWSDYEVYYLSVMYILINYSENHWF